MKQRAQAGNVVFMILLAIVLIGLVTAALRMGGMEGANVDKETTLVNATTVKQYASELERAVAFILTDNNASEVDIRFAHPDAAAEYGNDYSVTPRNQVFSPQGGGAEYRLPPSGVNDGSKWEFYGRTALPDVGTSRAELVAVLPNLTSGFCNQLNKMIGYDVTTTPTDDGAGAPQCIHSGAAYRFSNTDGLTGTSDDFSAAPNTVNAASFSITPATEGCVTCADSSRHYFHVLLGR